MTLRPAIRAAVAAAAAALILMPPATAAPAPDDAPSPLPPSEPQRTAEEPAAVSGPRRSEAAQAPRPAGAAAAEATWPAGSIGRQIGRDLGGVFTRPFRLRGSEWALPAALGAAAAGLYAVRDEAREEIQESRSAGRDEFLQDVRLTGKGAFVPAVAALLAGLGAARDSTREKRTALQLIESFAASATWALAGSAILAAERPRDGDSVRFFDPDGHGVSLDTALSASMIAPLERAYLYPRPGESGGRRFWRRAARGLLYLAPGLVALQRLNQDDHWLPDVFLGYAAGLLSGRVTTRNYPDPSPPQPGMSRYPAEPPTPEAGARRTASPGPPAPPSSLPGRSGR
jgi:hypothetical protein